MAFLKSANRHIKEGLLHLKEWELDEALKSFQHANKKKPENPDIMNYLSQTYAAMDDLDKASEYILKAITLEPQAPAHKQLYATYLMRQGKNHEAIPIIDETLELDKVDIIYILRGQADYNMGNLDSAIDYFDIALGMDSANPLAHHMKGLALYKLKRYEDAIPHLEKALEVSEVESLRNVLNDCKARTGVQ
ncbi:MAG: tetratricopeptide repeat protein [Candidatus Bathyarchaeota archaeon]|nr:tetratricopeptide repeat protein [Candidatus Bathyarchaeota archaeon]